MRFLIGRRLLSTPVWSNARQYASRLCVQSVTRGIGWPTCISDANAYPMTCMLTTQQVRVSSHYQKPSVLHGSTCRWPATCNGRFSCEATQPLRPLRRGTNAPGHTQRKRQCWRWARGKQAHKPSLSGRKLAQLTRPWMRAPRCVVLTDVHPAANGQARTWWQATMRGVVITVACMSGGQATICRAG